MIETETKTYHFADLIRSDPNISKATRTMLRDDVQERPTKGIVGAKGRLGTIAIALDSERRSVPYGGLCSVFPNLSFFAWEGSLEMTRTGVAVPRLTLLADERTE